MKENLKTSFLHFSLIISHLYIFERNGKRAERTLAKASRCNLDVLRSLASKPRM